MNLFPFLFITACLSCNSQEIERDIVLINVDTLDRTGIADEITIINSFSPKVIAIDLQFSYDTKYDQDTRLIQALDYVKNLVMISKIENYNGFDTEYRRFTLGSLPDYTTNAKIGFGNTILEKDELQTLRRFSTHEKVNGEIVYHFAIRTAMVFDSTIAMNFVKRNSKIIDVDYLNGARKFNIFSSSEVLNRRISKKDIEGKIVMIGFLGPGNEDKFFTPLNRKIRPYETDMYGLEYLANIVAQVLESG